MADISQVKLPNGDTYNLVDENALPLTGGQVTGPVTFGDTVSIDELTAGDLVVTGAGSFTNNLQVDTINGITVGEGPRFTDTVTTISTTGSGNAITAISANNGALTATKGATFLTSYTETDPTVPAWAKASMKPTYTASEVGAAPLDHTHTSIGSSSPTGDGTVSTSINSVQISASTSGGSVINTMSITGTATTIHKVVTPTADGDAANKKYVDDSIPKVYSSTNTGGYLTMATLPIYNGTVE